ncbi:MAG: hypothetical protein ACYTFI_22085 [Planctomycetota bacterium]|jgi:hypothetical protein
MWKKREENLNSVDHVTLTVLVRFPPVWEGPIQPAWPSAQPSNV